MKSTSVSAVRGVLFVLAIALPWVNPFVFGPSPSVFPWLLALTATACLMLLSYRRAPFRSLAVYTCAAPRWACPVARGWLLAGLTSCLIGLIQYFGASAVLEPWVNQTPLGTAFANLRQRNHFATLLNMALASLVWLTAAERIGGRWQWPALVAAALLEIGNVASSSRTGLLQLILLCVLMATWGGWRTPVRRLVMLTAVGAYVLATAALPWLIGLDPLTGGGWGRLQAGDGLCTSRLTLWSNVLHLIAQKPWWGWGWGELDYAHYMTLYPGARFCDILDNAHNLPLHLAVELGIPISLVVCGVTSWLVLRARPWRETNPTRQLAWSVLALILLHSLLEYPLWYGPFQMAAGLSVGLLWSSSTKSETVKENALSASWPRQRVVSGLNRLRLGYLQELFAIIVIAVAAAAATDYYRVSQIYLSPGARDPLYRDDTLNKIRTTWLFGNLVRFAELGTTPLTPANAVQIHALSRELLHYSPEPRVVEKLIESAALLGCDADVELHRVRYRVAFPQDYEKSRDVNRHAIEGIILEQRR